MEKNSFKDLEKIEMEEVSMRTDVIKNGIVSDIGIMRYVTSIVELYFPRILDLFVGLAGGNSISNEKSNGSTKKYPDMD